MSAFITWFKGVFASPADRSGLTAVVVSLITSIGGDLALPAASMRTDAFVAAAVIALYGVLNILRPDNAAIKSPALIADSEATVRDILTAFASKNPASFATIVSDAAKVASDFTVKAAGTTAALAIALLLGLGALTPAHAYNNNDIFTPSRVATYSAVITGLTPAASATDFFVIQGSATTVVRVKEAACFGTSTAAGSIVIVGDVRSTADSGDTSTSPTASPHDANDVAPTAVVYAYTANPTVGTLVAAARVTVLGTSITATGSAASNLPLKWTFGEKNDKEIILRGVAQEFSLNAGGNSFAAGTSLDCYVEWTEAGS
jgi:hypothetical protein